MLLKSDGMGFSLLPGSVRVPEPSIQYRNHLEAVTPSLEWVSSRTSRRMRFRVVRTGIIYGPDIHDAHLLCA
ncbi:MAG: hypothetical protein EOR68_33505 [Mesorhizobium sp.]|uniref:ectoine synthase n=1 Tax=Mesorhizobium sp. TaxID=1871066 RepID=UPI000FE9DF63|nr:MAG: hypothetical protein EOR68_33505 [Mesorhizobium sp.]TIP41447.1 MAG: hypothetical protein E5X77_26025 [Mesorhizobium sp.]TJV67781.1 MAG: hypothetical protein E5X76_32455 [Mesorhizobium sp.]